jgi:hypothetical protein
MNPDAIGESGSQFPAGSKSDGLDGLKQSLRDLCPGLNEGGEPRSQRFCERTPDGGQKNLRTER